MTDVSRSAARAFGWAGGAVEFASRRLTFRIPVLTWTTAYFVLWCYRCLCSVLAEIVILRLTGIADTRGYQTSNFLSLAGSIVDVTVETATGGSAIMQKFATELTKVIGGLMNLVFFGNPILINIGFQTLGFIGLVAFLRAVDPKQRVVLYGLLFLPSISVWSSMASKEALLTFFVGIVCAYIIKIYRNQDRITPALCICLFLIFAYKPHYLPALLLLIGVPLAARRIHQKATVAFLALACSFAATYVVHKPLDEKARWADWALSAMGGRSGRPQFLVEPNDYYLKAPEGMYRAFVGPTFEEISTSALHLVTFGESMVIIFALGFLVVRNLPNIPVYSAVLATGGAFWILFANYPLGVSNPGTAIRYRTGYILIVFLCTAVLFSRPLYEQWISELRERGVRRRRRWNLV